jgi:ABC-type branched-subunit amino acid transport system ATPase component
MDAARSRIKTGLARHHTVNQIEEGLPDHQNVFAYCNIQSDLQIRARGNVHSFNSLEDLDEVLTKLFREIENSARPTADQLLQGRAQAVAKAAALTAHQ